ncbi:hypothetical protein Y09_2161 [Brachybacterium sp. SW0106-09]|nr:hypothetical protein Y09_2161 [Brachybacterium sp. SW0106-09]
MAPTAVPRPPRPSPGSRHARGAPSARLRQSGPGWGRSAPTVDNRHGAFVHSSRRLSARG